MLDTKGICKDEDILFYALESYNLQAALNYPHNQPLWLE